MCLDFIKSLLKENTEESVATEYIYLWLNNYRELNDFGGDRFLIEDQGFCLSPKINVTHEYDKNEKKIDFYINDNDNYLGSMYGDIENIKAFVAKNGGGKTTVLRSLFKIIGYGFGNEGDNNLEYILLYKRGKKLYYHQSSFLRGKKNNYFM